MRLAWPIFFLLILFDSQGRNSQVFVENRGQIKDQNGQPRHDVLYHCQYKGASVFIGGQSFSYQFSRFYGDQPSTKFNPQKTKTFDSVSVSRIEVSLIHANLPRFENLKPVQYFEKYYNESGVITASASSELLLKQVYDGIDLKWYFDGTNLKYEYLVKAHANYHAIKLKIKGAKLSLGKHGELIMASRNGVIVEPAPIIFQSNKKINGQWVINGEVVTIDIPQYDSSLPGIIDPLVVAWGTYYGGASAEISGNATVDANGNIFLAGETQSAIGNIATSGAYQQTYGGAGSFHGDALLVKFDPNGQRLWATYYGGTGEETSDACFVDAQGNVYLTGITTNSNPAVHCTSGCFQSVFGGGAYDGFLAAFDGGGNRLWATFIGGEKEDYLYDGVCDATGHLYIVGSSGSNSNIATPGVFQSTNGGGHLDGFIMKFTTSGSRVWGTYMGGNLLEQCYDCDVDGSNNVYVCGNTATPSTIFGTAGAFQSTYNGNTDGYISKFDANGNRVWSTYYGGNNGENLYSIQCEANDVYVAGTTASNASTLVSSSAYQSTNAGGFDGLLLKFNTNGQRTWATFVGSTANETYANCSVSNGRVYIAGTTAGNSGRELSTPCTFQDLYGGGSTDGFILCFDTQANRQWGSYLGGINSEEWTNVTNSSSGDIILSGTTGSSASNFTTTNAHQTTYGGGAYDAWVVKFTGCQSGSASNTTPLSNLLVCAGKSTTLSCNLTCGAWMSGAGITISGSPSVAVNVLNKDTVFYLADISCGPAAYTAVNVTIIPAPILSVAPSPSVICNGGSRSYTFTGALNYTIDPPGIQAPFVTISPSATTIYTLTGINSQCTSELSFTQQIANAPTILTEVSSDSVCYNQSVILKGSGADQFSWQPASLFRSNVGFSIATLPATHHFTVLATAFQFSMPACTATQAIAVHVHSMVTASVPESANICTGNALSLTASGGKSYFWYPASQVKVNDQATAVLTPSASLIYTVVASNEFLCTDDATVQVTVISPTVYAGRDTVVKFGDQMMLRAQGDGQFKWWSEELLQCDSCASTPLTPFTDQCYTVTLTDTAGCQVSDVICIDVRDYSIYAPNVFTPNNDGLNDVFYVSTFGFESYSLSIYDRFGHTVFSSNDPTAGWSGDAYTQGVYVWKINWRIPGGKIGETNGKVLLIK